MDKNGVTAGVENLPVIFFALPERRLFGRQFQGLSFDLALEHKVHEKREQGGKSHYGQNGPDPVRQGKRQRTAVAQPIIKPLIVVGVFVSFPVGQVAIKLAEQHVKFPCFGRKIDGKRGELDGTGDQVVFAGMAQAVELGSNPGGRFTPLHRGKGLGKIRRLDILAVDLQLPGSFAEILPADVMVYDRNLFPGQVGNVLDSTFRQDIGLSLEYKHRFIAVIHDLGLFRAIGHRRHQVDLTGL